MIVVIVIEHIFPFSTRFIKSKKKKKKICLLRFVFTSSTFHAIKMLKLNELVFFCNFSLSSAPILKVTCVFTILSTGNCSNIWCQLSNKRCEIHYFKFTKRKSRREKWKKNNTKSEGDAISFLIFFSNNILWRICVCVYLVVLICVFL